MKKEFLVTYYTASSYYGTRGIEQKTVEIEVHDGISDKEIVLAIQDLIEEESHRTCRVIVINFW